MGGELVRQAYAASFIADERGESMERNERDALVYMASTAMDNDPEPRYWGGHEAIARYALGRTMPPGNATEEDRKARRSISETVRVAIAGLVNRGAIQREGEAYPGHSMVYRLTISEDGKPQGELGASSSSAWGVSKLSLLKPQADNGSETKETQDPIQHPNSSPRAPHLRPVDGGEIDGRKTSVA